MSDYRKDTTPDPDLSERIKSLYTEYLKAEDLARNADQYVDDAYDELLATIAEHLGKEEAELVLGSWKCEHSIIGKCVYDDYEDPAHDECIFCGDPSERK